MSVDSPEPRQRTVAELLAENGGQQSGRRRRRRAEDEPGPAPAAAPEVEARPTPPPPPAAPRGGPPPAPASNGYGTPDGHGAPDRYGNPDGYGQPNGYANGHGPQNGYAPSNVYGPPNGYAPPNGHGPQSGPQNGYGPRNGYAPPNGYAPEAYAAPPAPPSSPPSRGWNAPSGPAAPAPDAGPWGPQGPADVPTGAFAPRTPAGGAAFGGPPPDSDGGPPTQLGAPPLDDDHDDYDDRPDAHASDDGYDEIDDRAWTGEHADEPQSTAQMTAPHRARAVAPDGGPPTQAGFGPDELDDLHDADDLGPDRRDGGATVATPVGYAGRRRRAVEESGELDPVDYDTDDTEDDTEPRAAGTGQAWAMVIAQWIGGAIVGAGVWVGFRYLWTYFEIVALALSVVATVGLVLGVRALLRNDDLRTTMFAVLVGLLLTVSPALLVLLDR